MDFGLPNPSQNPPKILSKSRSRKTCDFSQIFVGKMFCCASADINFALVFTVFGEGRTFHNADRNHRSSALECKEKTSENRSEIYQNSSFFRAPNPIAFLTQFWYHFGTILGPFWEVLGSICLHFGRPGASGGVSWGSARPSWGLLGRFRTSKPQI